MRILKNGVMIGSVRLEIGGVKISVSGGDPGQQVGMGRSWGDLQKQQSIKMDLSVDGISRRFQWVVSNTDTRGDRQDRPKPALGITSQREKARLQQFLQTIHLIDDATESIWATYNHIPTKPGSTRSSTDKSAKWGCLEIRCRAVLLDEGVDKAFVSLMALLEGNVKMSGKESPGIEKFGGLSGSLFCCVM